MIEQGLTNYLETLATNAADRIYPDVLPQSEPLPAITYSKDGDEHSYTADGHCNLIEAEFQIDAWGNTKAEAKALFKQIYDPIKNHAKATMGSVFVDRVTIVTTLDVYEHTTEQYRSSIALTLIYRET